MKKLPDWDQQEQRISQKFKAMIEDDSSVMFSTWYEGAAFNSGMFGGRIDKIFIDNVEESPKETKIVESNSV